MSQSPITCPACGAPVSVVGPCEVCKRSGFFDEAASFDHEAFQGDIKESFLEEFLHWGEDSCDVSASCRDCGQPITIKNRVDIEEFKDLCHACYKKKPKHVCVDLDGVLAEYDGWKGPHYIGPPRDGAYQFLKGIVGMGYKVIIHTTRKPSLVQEWIRKHDLWHLVYKVTNEKLPALAYIDDRAMPFEGDFGDVLMALRTFVPYWKRSPKA